MPRPRAEPIASHATRQRPFPVRAGAVVSRFNQMLEASIAHRNRTRHLHLMISHVSTVPVTQMGDLMLTISDRQKHILKEDYLVRRIASYLQKHLPEATASISFRQLRELINQCVSQARSLDVNSERALAKWTYLNFLTSGKLMTVSGIREFMNKSETPQEEKVDNLMRSIAVAVKLRES